MSENKLIDKMNEALVIMSEFDRKPEEKVEEKKEETTTEEDKN